MKNNKEIDKVIRHYEKGFRRGRGLNEEINIRRRRHREEMLNLDKELEGKSREEEMEILDGMDERAKELIGCLDNRIEELEEETEKEEKDVAKEKIWAFGIGVVVCGVVAIASIIVVAVMGWIG